MTYYFSVPQQNTQPFIFWAPQYITYPFDIAIYLPELFTAEQTTPITQGCFTLGPNQNTNAAKVPYQITVPGFIANSSTASPIWQFDNTPIRSVISNDFIQFLLLIEEQGPLPGALDLVRLSLAQYLPLTFAETLFCRYSLNTQDRYVDLQPGMRVRLDYQIYQTIDPSPQNYLNGFVGSGTSYLDPISVSSGANLLTAFSPFLAEISTSFAPNQGGGAGPIDLSGEAFAYPYFRLFYPKNILSSDSAGAVGVTNNAVLVGADSFANLTAATTSYLAQGSFGPTAGVSAFFRGRVTITPEILLSCLGQLTYVALGTTLRQLLSRLTIVPRQTNVSFGFASQFFYRWMTADYSSGGSTWKFPAVTDGAFTFTTNSSGGYQLYSPVLDSLDVPVLGGDCLTFVLPSS